jgi:tryptophan synthase alpha chain
VLVADVPSLRPSPSRRRARGGVEPVLIAAPNTPRATLARIAAEGERLYLLRRPRRGHRRRCRRCASTRGRDRRALKQAGAPPPVLGFGISTPDHVRLALAAGAAGVISGSAIVDLIAQSGGEAEAFAGFVAG